MCAHAYVHADVRGRNASEKHDAGRRKKSAIYRFQKKVGKYFQEDVEIAIDHGVMSLARREIEIRAIGICTIGSPADKVATPPAYVSRVHEYDYFISDVRYKRPSTHRVWYRGYVHSCYLGQRRRRDGKRVSSRRRCCGNSKCKVC